MSPCILVVEDAPELVALYEDILMDEGYAVAVHAHGVPDMRDVERIAPRLIILDHLLAGDVDGLQMIDRLKQHQPTAAIPVILCTGATKTIGNVEDDVRAQGVRVLYKPFDLQELLTLTRELLQPPGQASVEGLSV